MVMRIATFALSDQMVAGALRTQATMANLQVQESSGLKSETLGGYGTDVRTDPVFLGLQKTRLLDPTLSLFGSNDHPGDYRASGCSACHVVYANDRSPVHSGSYARFGNQGRSAQGDPTIPKNEAGHPICGVVPARQRQDGEHGHRDGGDGVCGRSGRQTHGRARRPQMNSILETR